MSTSSATPDASPNPASAPRPARRWHWSLAGATALIGLWLAGQFNSYASALIDCATNFQLQIVVTGLCAAIYQFAARRPRWGCLILAVILLPALQLFSIYLPAVQPEPGPRTVRVLALNLFNENDDFASVERLIRESDADIINFVEYTDVWNENLADALSAWRWRVGPDKGNVIFSRFPAEEFLPKLRLFRNVDRMAIIGQITVEGREFLMFNLHTSSPTNFERLEYRDVQIHTLGSVVALLSHEHPIVVVGDFNATTSSHALSGMLRRTGLRDSRQGFGLLSTWPTWCWPMAICIDHVFVSGDVHVHQRGTGPNVGSDHLPVFTELSFPPRR